MSENDTILIQPFRSDHTTATQVGWVNFSVKFEIIFCDTKRKPDDADGGLLRVWRSYPTMLENYAERSDRLGGA